MGTLGVELGTGETLNDTADPAADAAERGNATYITPFSAAFREDQFLVVKLVHLLINNNTDINYQILVVPMEHLCKVPEKLLFYAITRLIIFSDSLSHRFTSLPLTLFRLFTFIHHLYFALNNGII